MSERLPKGCRLVEGVMTSLSAAGECNVAPMGPIVDDAWQRFILRPFKTSSTYRNIKATGCSVFHVTDDVLLIARGAVGQVRPDDDTIGNHTKQAAAVNGLVLTDACRYYELQVDSLDDAQDRTRIEMQAVAGETLREFFGFNRAKHAVIEAAILATRVHLTGRQHVLDAFEPLQTIVDKTGGEREHLAMTELWQAVRAMKESVTT